VTEVGVFPSKWLGGFPIQPDVAHDLAAEVGDRGEDATIDHVSLQLREPDFNLIQPRGVGRSKVKLNVGVPSQKLSHQRSFVDTQIIENDVNRLIGRAAGDDFLQERDELNTGVARSGLSNYVSGPRIQSREQR